MWKGLIALPPGTGCSRAACRNTWYVFWRWPSPDGSLLLVQGLGFIVEVEENLLSRDPKSYAGRFMDDAGPSMKKSHSATRPTRLSARRSMGYEDCRHSGRSPSSGQTTCDIGTTTRSDVLLRNVDEAKYSPFKPQALSSAGGISRRHLSGQLPCARPIWSAAWSPVSEIKVFKTHRLALGQRAILSLKSSRTRYVSEWHEQHAG